MFVLLDYLKRRMILTEGDTMTQPGGAANINGILYQILGTLDQAVTIRMQNVAARDGEIEEARLIVEPAGGGGDVQLIEPASRTVQQWKSKAAGGTWSLKEIVETVLPDLFEAVPDIDTDADTRYEFNTEGRIGNWSEAYEFFQSISSVPPKDPLKSLNSVEERHRIGRRRLSDRELFLHICDCVQRGAESSSGPASGLQRKVWHLLARFAMPPPIHHSQIVARLNEFLAIHVNSSEEIDEKRRALCGALLEVAAVGNQELTAKQLLRAANVPLHSFKDWPRLRLRMRQLLNQKLDNEKYCRELDAREAFRPEAAFAVLGGESGSGKSWQLARLASDRSETDCLAVWVPSKRVGKDPLVLVSQQVWNHGLDRDVSLTLDRVAARREQDSATAPNPWILVCVDDVRSLDDACYLADFGWEERQMQVAITTTVEIARQLADERACDVHIIKNFTQRELQSYLKARGVDWKQVADDVRHLISRPILAKIYCDLVGEAVVGPESEYQLMEAYWGRVDRHDFGPLRTLARAILDENTRYPWPSETIQAHGVSDSALERLEARGWMRDFGEGAWGIWHDRLLCWAVAQAIVTDVESGKLDLDDVASILQSFNRPSRKRGAALGYVPMDVLWLLLGAGRDEHISAELWKLIQCLESHDGYGHHTEYLYRNMVGTLGVRAVPVIVDRVRNSEDAEHNPIPKSAAIALTSIGRREPAVVASTIETALHDEHEPLVELGLRLAARFPVVTQIDHLWEMHRSNVQSEDHSATHYRQREITCAAFRAAVENQLDWLDERLIEKEPLCLHELVYTLGNLATPEMARIWNTRKEYLFDTVQPKHRRCLISCIVSFRDEEELPRLEGWSKLDEELVAIIAAQALSFFSPERSVRVLADIPPRQLEMSGRGLCAALLAVIPSTVCSEIRQICENRPKDIPACARLLEDQGDRIDPDTFKMLIAWLDSCLEDHFLGEDGDIRSLFPPLRIIESLLGETILDELRKLRGSDLEERLCQVVKRRIDKQSLSHDYEFANSLTLLKRIGGDGIRRATNDLLASENQHARLLGCELACVNPDCDTRRLLALCAQDETLWTHGSGPYPLIQRRATKALAALNENTAVVDAVVKWGNKVSSDLAEFRAIHEPMSDSEIDAAIALLGDDDQEVRANAVLALGLSGRQDLQPRIEEMLQNCSFDSPIAMAAPLALEDLNVDKTEMLDRIVQQYKSGQHKWPALKLLLWCFDSIDKEILVDLIPEDGEPDDLDLRLLVALAQNPNTRDLVRSRVRTYALSRQTRNVFFEADAPRILDSSEVDERDKLFEELEKPSEFFHVSGSKATALLNLAKSDPNSAFEFAEKALCDDDKDLYQIPVAMLKIDRARATKSLCDRISTTTDRRFVRSTAIALRSFGDVDEVARHFLELMQNQSWRARRAAAVAIGYQGPGFLSKEIQEAAFGDRNWAVCLAAQSAMRDQQREEEAKKLAKTLNDRVTADTWGTLDAILALSDPDCLFLHQEADGFVSKYWALPAYVRDHVANRLKRRREKIEQNLGSIIGRWDRGDQELD